MIMVKAGAAVYLVIEPLMPVLKEGDIVIDGSNSNFADNIRRSRELEGASKCA